MKLLSRSVAAAAAGLAAAVSLVGIAGAQSITQTTLASPVPSTTTPNVNNGAVLALTQVGARIIAGGSFTSASQQGSTASVTRNHILAFNPSTGTIDASFAPNLDGTVQSVTPGPSADTVYAAGNFGTANGTTAKGVVLLSTVTGQIVSGFKPAALNGVVYGVRLAPDGSRLYIGGSFTKVGPATHQGLATLNPTTGALDPYMNVQLTGHHNYTGQSGQANGGVGPRKLALSPDGKTLIAIGNFKNADGMLRDQLVRIDTSGATSAALDLSWSTLAYTATCFSGAYDTYMSDVDFAPDGSYFAVGATGGSGTNIDGTNSSCDTVARFETNSSGDDVRPTWLNYTGQDTIGSVAVTGGVIYVGGHQRWLNNENGYDYPGQGAVPRPGLAALDPQNGIPFSWNPGRNPRGVGAYALLVTSQGLYVGSDTDYIGPHKYLRKKLAFFPLAGGSSIPANSTASLPANVYLAGQVPTSANTPVLYRVNTGGPGIGATDNGPDWLADASDSDPGASYRNTGSNSAGYAQVGSVSSSVPASTPIGIFSSERWSPSDNPPLSWSFPDPGNTPVTVRLYFANQYSGTSQPGQRVFNVLVDGQTVLSNYDIVADVGNEVGTMKSFSVTPTDGTISISLTHVTENPLINGIEIVRADGSGSGNLNTLQYRSFDGSTAGATQQFPAVTGMDWSQVRGAFQVDGTLFYGKADGTFDKRSFNGSTFGPEVSIDPYDDPTWSSVDTGSGQTYRGTKPDLYGQMSSVTGMFYSAGKLYYTLYGSSQLFARYFTPESGIIGAHVFSYSGVDLSGIAGMTYAGGTLYYASRSTGDLMSVSFDGSNLGASGALVNGPSNGGQDWRARGLFLNSTAPPANKLPTASISASCTGLTCMFDGTGSKDADGTVTGYSWSFGDGSTGTGAQVEHTYAGSGPYTVGLTVTDNQNGQGSTTASVSPTATQSSSIAFVGVASTNGNRTTQSVKTPAATTAGNGMVLISSSATATSPADPAGWTRVRSVTNSTLTTTVWQRVATAADAGTTVSIGYGAIHMGALQLLVYSGTSTTSPVAQALSASDAATQASHTTPTATGIGADSWALSYWADKSSSTTMWTAPGGISVRDASYGTGGGRITALVGDTGPVSGSYGGLTATTDAAGAKAEQWTIVLGPAT